MSGCSENTVTKIGFLHPGQMGVTIAAAAGSAGAVVCWASEGRSSATADRARDAGLHDLADVDRLCSECTFLFSICPPDQAQHVAAQVAAVRYSGIYIDANAVSPGSAQSVASIVTAAGARYVDGGIIGPPARSAGTTRLYLSGDEAESVADLFATSVVDARVVGNRPGAASALKMAYAGWTKGSAALLMSQFALAKSQQVDAALLQEWSESIPGLAEKLQRDSVSNAAKAWRFVGEMNEIAMTLEEAGLSREWFEGAAETYTRLSHFKDQQNLDPDEVISALLPDVDRN